jgi:hypothetical protein
VTRDILFVHSKNVQAIRFHDGRATFCTWARRDGRSDLWITERTGHTPTTAMLARYTRMAQMLADLDYHPFPCVLHAIPELASGTSEKCPRCAPASSTSLSTRLPTGSKGRNRRSGGPTKQADRDKSRRAAPIEVLAP